MFYARLSEAEIKRYKQDQDACLKRLDDEIDRVYFFQNKVRKLEGQIADLKTDIGRRIGKRSDCKECGNEVAFPGAVFCTEKCAIDYSKR